MKIIDHTSDYSCHRKIRSLILKMANLSQYQSILTDSANLSKYEQALFDKYKEDYNLFEAGFLYIFSKPEYIEHIVSVFYDLTYKQRSNFYRYFESMMPIAINNGFLVDYHLILNELNKFMQKWTKCFKAIMYIGFALCLFAAVKSIFIAIYLILVLRYLTSIKSTYENNVATKQEDLIIQKLNSEAINSKLNWAKTILIKIGWLNDDGNIIISDS